METGSSHRILTSLLNRLPVMAYRCGGTPERRMELVSAGATQLTGYAPEEFTSGRVAYADLLHPEDADRVLATLANARDERRPFRVEYRIVDGDGHERWVWECGEGVYEGAELLAVEGFIADESERKAAALELSRSEGTLRAILQASPDVVKLLDLEGRFQWLSPAVGTVLGYSEHQLNGVPMLEIVHPEDRKSVAVAMSEITEARKDEVRLRYRAERLSGESIVLESRGRRVENGGTEGVVFIARDISQQASLEEALRTSHELVKAIVDGTPDTIFVKDLEGRYVLMNSAGTQLLGKSHDELIGRSASVIFHSAAAEEIRLVERELCETGRTDVREHMVTTPDGVRTMLCTRVPHRDEHGRIVGLIGIARDVTDAREAATALNDAKEEAERANRAKSEFLSRMSHELRTPMNAILGFAQVLEMDVEREEDQESVHQILRAGKHLLSLIDEVLDLSRIETERISFSLEPVRLADLVRESLDLVRASAKQGQVELISAPCDYYVQADQQRLKQVLLNLVSNAVKYNRAGGRVTVACQELPGERLRISITDTGPGLDEDQRTRIFTAFERLGAEASGIPGTGLGLSLSKALTAAMGGQLGLVSAPGEGSTFWVELPRVEGALPVDEYRDSVDPSSLAPAGASRRVLYIEDNVSNLRLVERILARRPEFVLTHAERGLEGLEIARAWQPDLILLDIHLPDISGGEVLRHLQDDETLRMVPVVVISADATRRQIDQMLEAGARDYLTKPLDIQKFLAAVDAALPREKE